MSLYLVVAHETAASPELVAKLRELAATDPEAEFVLLVPATDPGHHLVWVEGSGEAIARGRADEASTILRGAGLALRNTVVGPPDPISAVRREIAASPRPYALAVISTHPPGISRWLKRDLPAQVRRLGLPVEHVVADGRRRNEAITPSQVEAAASAGGNSDEPLSLAALSSWRGGHLYGRDGVVGDVRAILYDYATAEPVWLGVASHPLPFRTLLVPAGIARNLDGRLSVPLALDRIAGQPHIDIGEGFASLTDEAHIFEYFGMPFDELRDIRVLREGQPYPGTQRNWQTITAAETASAASQRP